MSSSASSSVAVGVQGDAGSAPSSRLPVVLGVGGLLVGVGLLYRAIVARTNGSFTYPLDDTFIHMAIGRTLASHGVYGITPHGFTAASSSIAWPLLLGVVDRLVGDHLLTPLVLNLAIGAGLVAYLARMAARGAARASPWARALWLVLVVAAIPLPTIVLLGMEHTAHILACVAVVALAADWLAGDSPAPPGALLATVLGASCLRYESLFLAAAVAATAAGRRRWRGAALVVLAAALPLALFGAYSVAHGWKAIPNSVLLKGNRIKFVDFSDVGDFFGGDFVTALCAEPHMLAALLGGAGLGVAAVRRDGATSPHALRIGLSVLAGAAHVQFASLNWFFRYEAYAVALLVANAGLFALDATSRPRPRTVGRAAAVGAVAVAVLALSPLARRTIHASQWTPEASANIFDQQVQTARFLKRYFADGPVVVNDIGAVAYFGGEPIVDLGGLASMEAARSKQFQMFHPPAEADVARLSAEAPVAVVYDAWVPHRPPTWVRMGRWKVPRCRSCAEQEVSIYATSPVQVARVWRALRDYTPAIPGEVEIGGLYLDDAPSVLPDAAEYVLSEDDTLLVTLPGLDPPETALTLDSHGSVRIPHAASLALRGVRVGDVADLVGSALRRSKEHDVAPSAPPSVRLLEPRRMRFAVAGRVSRPGDYRERVAPTVAEVAGRCGAAAARPGAGIFAYALRRSGNDYERVALSGEDRVRAMDVVIFP